jgi:uncharacterized membrane protein YkoI
MKTIAFLTSLLLLSLTLTGCATSEAQLLAQAKVSRPDAERAALARVPGGTIKEGELEKEHGKLIWSFDIATPGTQDITEVHVDAVTGQVVNLEKETPADQQKESREKK